MPVIPHNVPAFEIQPPCTLNDDGKPSANLRNDAQRVFDLIRDERHLEAQDLLYSVQERMTASQAQLDQVLEQSISSNGSSSNKHKKHFHFHFFHHSKKEREEEAAHKERMEELQQIQQLLDSKRDALQKLFGRCRLFRRVQENLNSENENWILASKHFGIHTYYRKEADGSLTIKLEGEMKDCPLFEQICVIKEVDLHHRWGPCCSSSMTIADLDKLDVVGWFMMGVPSFGLARDGCFRAIGCDNMRGDGSILLAGSGIRDIRPGDPPPEDDFLSSDPIIERLDIPPVPKRLGCGRMTIRKFEAKIQVISPTSAETKVVANINPNLSLMPQSLLDFIMKQLAGVMLAKLQDASKKAMRHPESNAHARKIREGKEFYQDWILPKFEAICELQGWDMPRIAALEVSDELLQHERNLKQLQRGATFNGQEEKIVENITTLVNGTITSDSDDDRRTHSDDELSSLSGTLSLWSRNPISAYLRETEMKVQQRKNDAIAQARRHAAARLLPKEFPSGQKTRLEELKQAKYRRLAATVGPTTLAVEGIADSNTYKEILSISQRFSRRLHNHGPKTRLLVTTLLVSLLFVMLHPEPYLQYVDLLEWDFRRTTWFVISLQDVGVVAYIFACAIPFFLVCDIALVYVFDILEIGSKTGRQIKRYYSDTVRFGVAIGSLGVVAASIFKALLKVWFRCFLWCLSELFKFLHDRVYFQQMADWVNACVPESTAAGLWFWAQQLWDVLSAGARYAFGIPSKLAYRGLIQSNFIGRMVEALVVAFGHACLGITTRFRSFVVDSIDAFEGKVTLVSWRAEAFTTARSLFSYTTVFLLTLLVLFSVSAKRSRPFSDKSTKEPVRRRLKSDMSTLSSEESISLEGKHKSFRSLGFQATPIVEGEVFEEATDGSSARTNSPDSKSNSTSGVKGGRSLRFRRSKTLSNDKKVPSDPLISTPETDSSISRSKSM